MQVKILKIIFHIQYFLVLIRLYTKWNRIKNINNNNNKFFDSFYFTIRTALWRLYLFDLKSIGIPIKLITWCAKIRVQLAVFTFYKLQEDSFLIFTNQYLPIKPDYFTTIYFTMILKICFPRNHSQIIYKFWVYFNLTFKYKS